METMMKIKIFEGPDGDSVAEEVNSFTSSVEVVSIQTGSVQRMKGERRDRPRGHHTVTVVYTEGMNYSAEFISRVVGLCRDSQELQVMLEGMGDQADGPEFRVTEDRQTFIDGRIKVALGKFYADSLIAAGVPWEISEKISRDVQTSDSDGLWGSIKAISELEVE